MQYLIVLEKNTETFGAYVPDLPGCIAIGESEAEALSLIQEAILLHIESLQTQGRVIPIPQSSARCVEIML